MCILLPQGFTSQFSCVAADCYRLASEHTPGSRSALPAQHGRCRHCVQLSEDMSRQMSSLCPPPTTPMAHVLHATFREWQWNKLMYGCKQHLKCYTVSPPTVIATPFGTSSPRCMTHRKLPSPQCGRSFTPGCIRRNCDLSVQHGDNRPFCQQQVTTMG